MADFVEVLKHKRRMCYCRKCSECPMSTMNNGEYVSCDIFMSKHPENAEEIIMEWAKENPAKTNADKFKEVFGVDIYYTNEHRCSGIQCPNYSVCDKCEYKNFWEQEYKEKV